MCVTSVISYFLLLPGFKLNRFTAKASALDYPDGGFLCLRYAPLLFEKPLPNRNGV